MTIICNKNCGRAGIEKLPGFVEASDQEGIGNVPGEGERACEGR